MAALVAHHTGITRRLLFSTLVLVGVFLVLAVTPAPVTFPDGPWETALLLKGALALLIANIVIALPARPSVERGTRVEAETETLLALRDCEHFHVLEAEGFIGVVDEVLGGRDGEPQALVVSDGWFGARRFLVPLDAVRAIDGAKRTITLTSRS